MREHQLETFPQCLIACAFQRGERGALVEILFAFDRAAATDLTRFAGQGPATDQIRFQLQLHEAWCFASIGVLLQEEAHGRIVKGDVSVRAAGTRH